jgi:hypothetical protein
MKKAFVLSTLLLSPLLLAGCFKKPESQGFYNGYEIPKYNVVKQDGNIELREYKPALIAEVEIAEADREKAVGKGFRILASYIFGDNIADKSIAMTAPVTQTVKAESTTIKMTAPVTQISKNNSWLVQFTMPSKYTLETLPKAKNEQIKFYNSNANKAIAVTFSGFVNDKKVADNKQILQNYAAQNSLKISGEAIIAYYNDPFTFPWNRRNEVMFEVK